MISIAACCNFYYYTKPIKAISFHPERQDCCAGFKVCQVPSRVEDLSAVRRMWKTEIDMCATTSYIGCDESFFLSRPRRSARIDRPTNQPWMKLKVHKCACIY